MSVNKILSLNSILNESKLSKKEIDDAVKMLYKSVDLNVDDNFAKEMIIISMDEMMHKNITKKDAADILKAFDKKHTRIK